MHSYDDRWMLLHPLTVIEFTSEHVKVFDCSPVSAEFYQDRLRKLVVVDITNLAVSTHQSVSESFIIQHGEPLPNTRYLGVAKQMCHMDRYFRIISEQVEFPFGSFLGAKATYNLAGLPGEGQGALDRIFDEVENERNRT